MKKFLTTFACFALVLFAAVGLVGCGQKVSVSFGEHKGKYENQEYTIAATKWTKQEDEKGFAGVWKLDAKSEIAKNAKAKAALGLENEHVVAITFKIDGYKLKDAKIRKVSLKEGNAEKDLTDSQFDDGDKENVFTYITTFTKDSKGFILYFDFAEDDVKEGEKVTDKKEVAYKFIVDGANQKFAA